MTYCSIREAAAKCNMTESTLRYYEKNQMPLLEIVICLKNTHMPIKGFKQYIDWVIEGESPIKLRLDMMRRHKRSVLDEMSSTTKALKGIEIKICTLYQKLCSRDVSLLK